QLAMLTSSQNAGFFLSMKRCGAMEKFIKIGLLLIACGLFWMMAISRVHVEVLYTRKDQDDLFRLKLRALYGLIRYKLEIPIIDWNSMQKRVTFMRESMNLNMQDVIGKG